jgi:ribonuclease BN (tRNA processing enzyme)
MAGFQFIPLGVGDAFSAVWYSSSLLLSADGVRALVDCPHPIRKILREAGEKAGQPLDLDDVSAMILTHLHADHSSAVEGYGFYNRFFLKRKGIIFTHPAVAKNLWDGHLRAGMEVLIGVGDRPTAMTLEDYFEIRPLSESAAVTLGPFQIECRQTRHHIFTTALRIRAAGRMLGCSADTSYDEGLIAWLNEADTIIHETNVGIHTPYAKLAALPAEIRQKMYLIHYPDDFDFHNSIIPPLQVGRVYSV